MQGGEGERADGFGEEGDAVVANVTATEFDDL